MIDGKQKYLLYIQNKEQEDALRELVKSVNGNDKILNILNGREYVKPIEVTEDLKSADLCYLRGYMQIASYQGNQRFAHDVLDFIEWYKHEYLILKNYSIIKHIPYASVTLPDGLSYFGRGSYFVNPFPTKYRFKMADLYIDELFEYIPGIEIKAPYTRLFCDVERSKNGSKEHLTKFEQNYKLIKFYDGNFIFRTNVINGFDWDKYIDNYYTEYHKKLNRTIRSELSKGKEVILLNIHTFSEEEAAMDKKKGPYPDVCISVNKDFRNNDILHAVTYKIRERGLTYKINFPYSGSFEPHLRNKEKVHSITIKLNRRCYL